jgi:hypothetical protein
MLSYRTVVVSNCLCEWNIPVLHGKKNYKNTPHLVQLLGGGMSDC